MTDDPKSRGVYGLTAVLPEILSGPDAQNPAPFPLEGQVDESRVRALSDQIVRVFLNSLPSNYVSQSKGPYYAQQFQAAAEELARIQVASEDAYEDVDFDFTRSEVLWQFLAGLVFPDGALAGIPDLQGDVTYREFLKKMVLLLLRGSKTITLLEGVEALTDAEVSVFDKAAYIGLPGVGWGLGDRFTFEVNVAKTRRTTVWDDTTTPNFDHYHTVKINAVGEGTTTDTVWTGATGTDHTHAITGFLPDSVSATGIGSHTHDLLSSFPDLPVELEKNVRLVLKALRPAHTLYDYRNLFRETYRQAFTDDSATRFDLAPYYYDDLRKYCTGVKAVGSANGTVLSDRYTLNDTVSFRAVRVGAAFVTLDINDVVTGQYQVREVLEFPYGNDPVARAYTTAPTGLSGTAIVLDGAIVDGAQDWAGAVPGEVLTFASGPNAGSYTLETLLGLNGGALGVALGPATEVRPAPSFVRMTPRFPTAGGGVRYSIVVDRLGVRTPITVTNEDVTDQFYLPPAGFSSTLWTEHGPLVRGYGDATPATPLDVTVLLNGVPQVVSGLNPYTGEITLAAPIARFATTSGSTVTVTYQWFPVPLQGLSGLNTKGLTLNKWDLRRGRNTTSPTSGGLWGGFRTSRFGMAVALGRYPTRKPPVRVAHRYIAFERAYTSALNSPTTLLLNQAPGRASVPYAEADVVPTTVQYEGTAVPTSPWVAKGAVAGTSDGDFYTLTKTSGTEVGYWGRDFELPVASMVGAAARIQVIDYTLDGVFTGIALGYHDNQRLYLAGALVVNGVKHIGLLARPGNLSNVSSWVVGPQTAGRVTSSTVVTCTLSEAPTVLTAGDRFQIITGNQAGVYTISQLYRDRVKDRLTLVVASAFPADPALLGNRDVAVVFETLWDEAVCSWRIYASTRNQTAQVYFGGSTGGGFSRLTASPILASPAYLGPDVLPQGAGRFVWGSFSRKATNTATWDFVRYLSTPDGGTRFSRGTVIDTTMTEEPEDGDWYVTTPWGDAAVGGGVLRLTSTPASVALDASYGYAKVDPFLNGRRVVAFDGKLTVYRDTSGAGGAALSLKDTHREARLGTILYQDNGAGGKRVFPQQVLSLLGATNYTQQGWSGTGAPSAFANGPTVLLSGDETSAWAVTRSFPATVTTARTLEFRLAIQSYVVGVGGNTGLVFTAVANGSLVGVSFSGPDLVELVDLATSVVVGSYSVAWSDGEPRTYRVEIDPTGDSVELYVDGVLAGVPVLWSAFPITVGASDVSVRNLPEASAVFGAALSSLSLIERLDGVPNLDRTFGLWRGGAVTDLDNWAVPRTDGLAVPNSDPASVIVSMDWSAAECWVRVFVDPTFGAVFLRPDLLPPSGYTGTFATQSLDPTAAWARIEYSRLPRDESSNRFGVVAFGALNPAASSLQDWNEVRYRVFTHTSIDYRAPQRMALNQWNVITSGDYLKDVTPEQVIIASLTPTRVSLRPAHIFANRVFQVIVEGVPVPQSEWRFNQDSQEITLFTPLASAGYPVSVVFVAAKPITTSYLLRQPLPESQTLLNEGTPPVPTSQVGQATVSTVSGDGGPTPAFPPPVGVAAPGDPGYFLKDQYLVRQFADDPDALYEQMEFFQLEDNGSTGQITSFCDGPGNGTGLHELDFSGVTFSERMSTATPSFGRGSGTSRTVLYASGGATGPLGGLLGPASYVTPYSGPNPAPSGVGPAMLYPNAPSAGVVIGSGGGASNRRVLWVLRDSISGAVTSGVLGG